MPEIELTEAQIAWDLSIVMDIVFKIGVSLVIALVGMLVVKLLKACINKVIHKNKGLSERKANTLNAVVTSVSKYTVCFIVVCQILSVFGVDVTSIIAVAGVGSVAIAFGAQSLVQDIITGLFILAEDQFGVGDVIEVGGFTGTVESIGIRTTRLRSGDGNVHIVPNGQVKIVTNMSKGFNRAIVEVGIAYEEDIDRVCKVLDDEMSIIYKNNSINGLIAKPQVLGIIGFGDSAVNIRISADSAVGENWNIERELRRFIKNRLDKENICIPYPQTVVHIEK